MLFSLGKCVSAGRNDFYQGLSDWLYKECGLPELGQKLNMLQKNKEKPESFVTAILNTPVILNRRKSGNGGW
ncbi:MAG: hypothetical protein ACLR0F_24440 [Eisenbergiella sp.]